MPSSTISRAAAAATSAAKPPPGVLGFMFAIMRWIGAATRRSPQAACTLWCLDVAHARRDDPGPTGDVGRVGPLLEALGGRQHHRQPRRLQHAELARTDVEIVARRGLGAEHAFAPLDVVEVDLEDALLGQQRLEHHRDDQLLALAREVALAGEEQVLRQLLGDRRAADQLGLGMRRPAAALGPAVDALGARLGALVAFPGALQRVPLDAAV